MCRNIMIMCIDILIMHYCTSALTRVSLCHPASPTPQEHVTSSGAIILLFCLYIYIGIIWYYLVLFLYVVLRGGESWRVPGRETTGCKTKRNERDIGRPEDSHLGSPGCRAMTLEAWFFLFIFIFCDVYGRWGMASQHTRHKIYG